MGKKGSSKNLIAIAVCFVILAVSAGLLIKTLSVKAASSDFVPVIISANSGHSLAIDQYGYIWAWGSNSNGRLGDGTTTARHEPTRHNNIHYGRKYIAISAGVGHSLAIDTDGYLWAWGGNNMGMLGDGTTADRHAPIRQNGAHFNRKYTAVSTGYYHSIAIDTDGYLWSWGNNNHGQLGNGTTTDSLEPVRQNGIHYSRKYIAISAGHYYNLAIDTDGYLWAWGDNSHSQLGDGTTANSLEPIRQNGSHYSRKYSAVSASHTATLSSSFAIDRDGYLWVWGNNVSSRLGLGSGSDLSIIEPTRQNGAHGGRKYTSIAVGAIHAIAIDVDGYIWAWGATQSGQLGVGDGLGTVVSEPARRNDASSAHFSRKYSAIAAGGSSSIALDQDGYMWSWGSNVNGQLGNGTTTDSSDPIQISITKPTANPGDPTDPYSPTSPVDKKDKEPTPVGTEILLYSLFGAGILALIALLIVSYSQRDRKPKKKITIFQ